MESQLSDIEKKVLAVIQHGMPITPTPYADMANQAGISADELLDVLNGWKQTGILRRIGAIVSHFQLGLTASMMVVWQVPPARIEEVGRTLAAFREVSHAYQRPASDKWPFNLYTMVHDETCEQLKATVEQMAAACGIDKYQGLETVEELKKVPPTYITGNC